MGIKTAKFVIIFLLSLFCIAGCEFIKEPTHETIIVKDQLGRKVEVPKQIERIAAFRHFGGKIVHALQKQHLLIEKSIYGSEAAALSKIDKEFAALPDLLAGHSYNFEGIVALRPQIVFMYATSDRTELEQFENVGIPVVFVKGETIEDSFEAVKLMSKVFNCEERGKKYIKACRDILDLVENRLKNHVSQPAKVMFAGPKNIYSVATGNMLQSEVIEFSGGVNVAKTVEGFWAQVSPEQIAKWNPDVIFLGTYKGLETYGKNEILNNPHVQTINAVKNSQIYIFPSNVGWWDYPAPNCVLGVVWSAKTLYPELFSDIDITAIANQFYKDFVGYTFEELGGRLN
ncbi:MAG: ABC transporter substrate-binding protein [Desulfobacteraceae bacterium]|nr:ABC transporter substrate-binding protein [Desulfobacteraceae bacterium]